MRLLMVVATLVAFGLACSGAGRPAVAGDGRWRVAAPGGFFVTGSESIAVDLARVVAGESTGAGYFATADGATNAPGAGRAR